MPATRLKVDNEETLFPRLKLLLLLLHSELVLASKLKKSLKQREKNGELSDFYLLMNGSSVTAATVTILSLITLSIHCPAPLRYLLIYSGIFYAESLCI